MATHTLTVCTILPVTLAQVPPQTSEVFPPDDPRPRRILAIYWLFITYAETSEVPLVSPHAWGWWTGGTGLWPSASKCFPRTPGRETVGAIREPPFSWMQHRQALLQPKFASFVPFVAGSYPGHWAVAPARANVFPALLAVRP